MSSGFFSSFLGSASSFLSSLFAFCFFCISFWSAMRAWSSMYASKISHCVHDVVKLFVLGGSVAERRSRIGLLTVCAARSEKLNWLRSCLESSGSSPPSMYWRKLNQTRFQVESAVILFTHQSLKPGVLSS